MRDYLLEDSNATGNDNVLLTESKKPLPIWKNVQKCATFVLFVLYMVRSLKLNFLKTETKLFWLLTDLKIVVFSDWNVQMCTMRWLSTCFVVFTFFASAREPLIEAVNVNGPIANRIFIYHQSCALFVLGSNFHQTLISVTIGAINILKKSRCATGSWLKKHSFAREFSQFTSRLKLMTIKIYAHEIESLLSGPRFPSGQSTNDRK